MFWLTKIVDEVEARFPDGEIIVESGISPSGGYHMGYLREIITCDAIKLALEQKGRQTRHVHFVDDLDGFRKVPAGVPAEYEQYLSKPLCDMPAPDGSDRSYADYALQDFLDSVAKLGIEIDVIRSHEKYRSDFFVGAIEKTLENLPEVRKVLEEVSGRQLEKDWAPIQVNEDGYLKNRRFVSINPEKKELTYLDSEDQEQTTRYTAGKVKLNWRLDWPARWWLLGVNVEPSGKDHSTKGGSYDTGAALMEKVFKATPPIPVPYNFVNRAGDTKKMSASTGNGILMSEVVAVLPPEVARYFILRSSPDKLLFFDPVHGVAQLIDEFAELLNKPAKSADDEQLLFLCRHNLDPVISRVPFTHLVASYQAALKDPNKTIEIIRRSSPEYEMDQNLEIIKDELKFIEQWLEKWAPDDVKFELAQSVEPEKFSEDEKKYLAQLADEIAEAPKDADGEWFHKAVYDIKEHMNLAPEQVFKPLYRALIGKESGPRAGWFLSILPRDWLAKRLRLEQ